MPQIRLIMTKEDRSMMISPSHIATLSGMFLILQ
jgi:hypothetical protein